MAGENRTTEARLAAAFRDEAAAIAKRADGRRREARASGGTAGAVQREIATSEMALADMLESLARRIDR